MEKKQRRKFWKNERRRRKMSAAKGAGRDFLRFPDTVRDARASPMFGMIRLESHNCDLWML